MSNNIFVVNFRLPENFQETVAFVNPMMDIDVTKLESIYKEFHDEAMKRFPC